ncbi:hypothetical protein GQ600_15534 [Phytophthora cactorum]|nr:hypothetical protein GQ600_15534 [Phytophthora cactorum]
MKVLTVLSVTAIAFASAEVSQRQLRHESSLTSTPSKSLLASKKSDDLRQLQGGNNLTPVTGPTDPTLPARYLVKWNSCGAADSPSVNIKNKQSDERDSDADRAELYGAAGAKADNPGRQLHRDNSPPSTVTKPFGPFLAASKKRDYARQLRRESIIGDIVGNIGSILNNLTPEPTPARADGRA